MAQGINSPIDVPELGSPALLEAAAPGPGGIAWCRAEGLVPYAEAVAAMEARVAAIAAGDAPETVWLLEHPPLYTAGTSAQPHDLLAPDRFPVHAAGRGGQYTYHGPGQRIAYVMLDLKRRGADVRCYVHDLEEWAIRALCRFHVRAERRPGRVGLWVPRDGGRDGAREDKIGAIGVRVRRWVTFHGMALNVEPDLRHFDGIVPCGIAARTGGLRTGVTSLVDLGLPVSLGDLDDALAATFASVFGASAAEAPRRAAACAER